jgi:DNA/RNA-binding domain of Phe-tRNA-synthetase-like protein
MIALSISPEIRQACPRMALGCIQCDVQVADSPSGLLAEIDAVCTERLNHLKVEDIHTIPAIAATRDGYRALGKEPSRYRPSAEALIRRVLQGKGLYRVNNVVDLLNLVSIRTGFSIGGWDVGRMEGEAVLGIGRADEPYVTIGRGEMNIEFFPVFRDAKGAFGTPTSDSERTMVRPETRAFLMVFYAFDGTTRLQEAMDHATGLLQKFAQTTQMETQILT